MPRIPDQFLECVVYLYASEQDAMEGRKTGGSGFIVAVPLPRLPDFCVAYAVTNMHVIENGASTLRVNTKDGKLDVFDLDPRQWIYHPAGDDLAICKLPFEERADDYDHSFISEDNFLTTFDMQDLNIGLGDETFEVGRFFNQEGRQKNLPSLRFGNIAQMPWEPIRQARGNKYFNQESFLVEARSQGGFSGSPVFVHTNPGWRRPPAKMTEYDYEKWTKLDEPQTFLLGVCWGHINDWQPVRDATGEPISSGLKVRDNAGMMAVVPAWKITEMLHMPELVKARREEEDAEIKKRQQQPLPPASTDSVEAPAPKDANPQHREDFTSLLGKAARTPPQGG
jgi:hypothetical protein